MLGCLSVVRSCRLVAGDRDRDDRDRAAGERDLGLCVAGLACRTISRTISSSSARVGGVVAVGDVALAFSARSLSLRKRSMDVLTACRSCSVATVELIALAMLRV